MDQNEIYINIFLWVNVGYGCEALGGWGVWGGGLKMGTFFAKREKPF
jgi:hypothetical protein